MFLLIIAIAPSIALIILFYYRDRYEKEPWILLWKCFGLGAFSTVIAVVIERIFLPMVFSPTKTANLLALFVAAFFIVGLSEEFSKYIVLRYYAWGKSDFNEPYDGIIYSVVISLGFATFENIFYVFSSGVKVGIIRALTAIPGHTFFGVIMGYFVGQAHFNRDRRKILLAFGFFGAVIAHGIYNFLLLTRTWIGFGLFVLLLISGWIFLFYATDKLGRISPFKESE
ncbi:PrsW family intramembrane metalloprotease [candidate division WOR-3 bacterium]|nr:PrsW family intramembrane metalloprotease [candidate division WOR-3 bacterium]MCK4528660.1 PrsW family intramembrane metalloprotease [candidate division WOR-3 bacterium]